jgi:predicted RNA-binding protein with PIN domain
MYLLIDGMNVIGSRADGWWRDREGAMRALIAELADLGVETGEKMTVVLDSRPFEPPETDGSGPKVVFAWGSRGAGDDEIVRIVREASEPRSFRVVTSDAALRERVGEHGAEVESSGAFRRRLDQRRRQGD